MVIHSSILVCRVPRTEEPSGLQSIASQRVGLDWATDTLEVESYSLGWRQQNSRKLSVLGVYFTWVNLGSFFFFFSRCICFFHRKQREFWWSQPYQSYNHLRSTTCECADTSNPACASWGSQLRLSQDWLPAQRRIFKHPHAPMAFCQPSEILP